MKMCKTLSPSRNLAFLAPCAALLVLAVAVACGSSADEVVVEGVANCDGELSNGRYNFQLMNAIDMAEREGEPTDDDAYDSEPFRFEQRIEGAFENGNFDVVGNNNLGGEGPGHHLIQIGDGYWMSAGENWQYNEIVPGRPSPLFINPISVCRGLEPFSFEDSEGAPETVNGVDAIRYEMENEELTMSAYLWTPGSDMGRLVKLYTGSIWIAEHNNMLIKADLEGEGTYSSGRILKTKIFVELHDLGDDGIKVESPA